MAKTLTTASVPRQQKLEFWNRIVSETFVDLGCTAGDDRAVIDGEIEVARLAGMQLATVSGTPQLVARGRSELRASRADGGYLVGVQTRGSCIVTQDGRSTVISGGNLTCYDTQRAYSLQLSDDFEQIVVQFPRAVFEQHVPRAASLTARSASKVAGASRVALTSLAALRANLDDMTADAAVATASGIEHLLFAAFAEIPGGGRADVEEAGSRRELIKSYLLEHLRDPSLSVAKVSADLHLSASSVHRAFAGEGDTMMTWVWQRRLEMAYRELGSSRADRVSLTNLAHEWGFSTLAHFSRAFRARYGQPPSALLS